MAYTPHVWVDGELITAEKMNDLEAGAGQAAQPGPKGDPGAAGAQGPKGDKGDPGAGLAGSAAVLASLAADADASAMASKINEMIGIMIARGISKTAPQP